MTLFPHARILAATLPLLLAACGTQQAVVRSEAPATVPAPVAARPQPAEAPSTAAPVLKPSEEAVASLRETIALQRRAYEAAAPLMMANTALCSRHAHRILGLTAKNRDSFPPSTREVAAAAFGLGERLKVMTVMPGSGAAETGVQEGDELVAIDGKSLPTGANAERDGGMMVRAAMKGHYSLGFTVQRDGRSLTIQMPFTRACAFSIEASRADFVNSYADGMRILLTRGMFRYAQSREELAYVIAREMAHSILITSPRRPMIDAIDLLQKADAEQRAASLPRLPAFLPIVDATADRLALYLLARAGYGIDGVPTFWERLARQHPASEANSYTALHPATAYRMAALRQTVRVVKAKREKGAPLLP